MKKVLFTLIALVFSATAFAQLIANKTDNRVTFGIDLFNDFQLGVSDNWDSRMVNQGVSCSLTYNFPLGESSKHTVSIGLGVSSHNYFSYTRIMNPYTNGDLILKDYRDVEGFKRFKVNPVYGEVPLVLNFRIKDQIKVGIGFKVGVMIGTKIRYVGPDESGTLTDESGATINEKYQYISNVERMAYSATFRIGWKWVSVYTAYQFNQVFSVGHNGPTFHPLSVGVTFTPF